MTLHKYGGSAVRLGKGKGKKEKNVITTRGIRSWSPIQVLTPTKRDKKLEECENENYHLLW